MVDRLVDPVRLPPAQLRERRELPVTALDADRRQVMEAGPDRTREPQLDTQGVPLTGQPHRTRVTSRQDESEGPGDLVDRDAVQARPSPGRSGTRVSGQALRPCRRPPRPPARCEAPGHRAGRGDEVVVGLVRAAVDLGHERGEHRRPRRQLDDLDPRVVSVGQRGQPVVQPQRDRVALRSPVLLADEVHPDLGGVRHLPQIVVPHQSVEIDRAGQADVADDSR